MARKKHAYAQKKNACAVQLAAQLTAHAGLPKWSNQDADGGLRGLSSND